MSNLKKVKKQQFLSFDKKCESFEMPPIRININFPIIILKFIFDFVKNLFINKNVEDKKEYSDLEDFQDFKKLLVKEMNS